MTPEERLGLNISTARLIWRADIFNKLLPVLPYVCEPERLAAVKEKGRDGETVLHVAVSNPELLCMMLALLTIADALVLLNGHSDIFSGDNIELLKSVLYEKLNTYVLDEAISSRVKASLDVSKTLGDLIRIMNEMQVLRPQFKSGPGFFQGRGLEKDAPQACNNTLNNNKR